jgi:hypothetical protein
MGGNRQVDRWVETDRWTDEWKQTGWKQSDEQMDEN